MENSYDQLVIQYSETDKESYSVKLICIFLVLIFALAPLAEIVPDFDYNKINHKATSYTCLVGWESFEPLSFKEIK